MPLPLCARTTHCSHLTCRLFCNLTTFTQAPSYQPPTDETSAQPGSSATEAGSTAAGAGSSTSFEERGEGGGLYAPRVSTWGVFPRPANISAAFGGGRDLKPGQVIADVVYFVHCSSLTLHGMITTPRDDYLPIVLAWWYGIEKTCLSEWGGQRMLAVRLLHLCLMLQIVMLSRSCMLTGMRSSLHAAHPTSHRTRPQRTALISSYVTVGSSFTVLLGTHSCRCRRTGTASEFCAQMAATI